MTPERADWHLANWAVWSTTGGYAHLNVQLASLEAGYQRSSDIDEMYENYQTTWALATDAVVRELPGLIKEAVEAWYLGRRWASGYMLSPTVTEGQKLVALGLRKRGIV